MEESASVTVLHGGVAGTRFCILQLPLATPDFFQEFSN